MTEFTKLTPSYQGGEFAKPEHVIEVQEAFAPIESELADHEARVTAAEAGISRIEPLARTPGYVAMLGDSITLGNGTNDYLIGARSYANWACIASEGRLIPNIAGNFGVAGQTSTQIAARVSSVTSLTPKPSLCFVMAGTNDCNGSLNLATYATNIQAIVAALRAASIEPVLSLIPPRGTNAGEAAKINAWLSIYCAKNGIQLIDLYTTFQDASTGGWRSGYDAGDGVHPSNDTAKLMGQMVWDALKTRIDPQSKLLLTAHASDPLNLVANGVFVGDANTDGTADQWSVNGTPGSSDSLVSGGATVPGNWQKLVLSMSGSIFFYQNVYTGWAVGDLLLFAGRFRTSLSNTESVTIQLNYSGGTPNVHGAMSLATQSIGSDGMVFAMLTKVTPGTTLIQAQLRATADGSGGSMEFAQVTLRNLTALGLA